MIFEPAFECLPREELQALQLERLRALVARSGGGKIQRVPDLR